MTASFNEPVARALAAVLFAPKCALTEVENSLIALLGPIMAKTQPHPFDYSSYYTSEMGPNLLKYYLVFGGTIKPMDIVRTKHETSRLEWDLAERNTPDIRRSVNIDPGYFTHAQLVLATHKNYAHRVSLGQGVFAELTYLIQGKEWTTFPWTYPDYRRPETQQFFLEQRAIFLKETKDRRPPPGSRVPMWKLLNT